MNVTLLKENEAIPYQWYYWSTLDSIDAVFRLRENVKNDNGKTLYIRKSGDKYKTYRHISEGY